MENIYGPSSEMTSNSILTKNHLGINDYIIGSHSCQTFISGPAQRP